MSKPQKEPLRVLSEPERQVWQRIVRATSERLDVIKRAKALVAVARGLSFAAAAREAAFASSDTLCHLVARFNRQGLLARRIATGRGRKPTYSQQERQQMGEMLKSEAVRQVDASATWSLSLLEQKLRETGLPKVGASTVGRLLHQAGYVYGPSRTWYQTGTVLRKRKEGGVRVHDPKTQEKKRDGVGLSGRRTGRPRAVVAR